MNDIILTNYHLIKFDEFNKQQLTYLKDLMQDEFFIKYLGHLEQDRNNVYIISDSSNNYIGYFSMSNPVVNNKNLTSITLYYAIDNKHQCLGHATKMLTEVSEFLLDKIDMLVLMIDKTNTPSMKVAQNSGFNIEYQDEDDAILTKYNHSKDKIR